MPDMALAIAAWAMLAGTGCWVVSLFLRPLDVEEEVSKDGRGW